MQERVLKVGDAKVRQKDAATKHTESVGLSFRVRVCQPAGIMCYNIQTEPHLMYLKQPQTKGNMKTDNFSHTEMHLQNQARFPLKMEIRVRQEELHTVGHH